MTDENAVEGGARKPTTAERWLESRLPASELRRAKRLGYGDARIAALLSTEAQLITEQDVRAYRTHLGLLPTYRPVESDEPGTTAPAVCFRGSYAAGAHQAARSERGKVVILKGGRPEAGQRSALASVRDDAVHAVRAAGYEAVIFDPGSTGPSPSAITADRIYAEPLTTENLLNVLEFEQPDGVIVQFGGRATSRLAREIADAGFAVMGTGPESVALVADRPRLSALLREKGIPQPKGAEGCSADAMAEEAGAIGYPVLLHAPGIHCDPPTEIIEEESRLREVVSASSPEEGIAESSPMFLHEYVEGAVRVDVDAIADREGNCTIGGMIERIESKGLCASDSDSVIPMQTVSPLVAQAIRRATQELAKELKIVGFLNLRFAVKGERAMVLNINPWASRTVAFVSNAIARPLAQYAVSAMLGETLKDIGFVRERATTHVCVRAVAQPRGEIGEQEPPLPSEVVDAREAMGIAPEFAAAYWKAQLAVARPLPRDGAALLSVHDDDKLELMAVARGLSDVGFELLATSGTRDHLKTCGLEARVLQKCGEEGPCVTDALANGEIQIVVLTAVGARSRRDAEEIRHLCQRHGISLASTIAAAQAAVQAIAQEKSEGPPAQISLQDYHESLTARYRI